MKIVHFTNNIVDGAGKAAYRLHKEFQNEGVESLLLVCDKTCEDDSVIQVCNSDLIRGAHTIKCRGDVFIRCIGSLPFVLGQIRRKLKVFRWKPLTLFNFNISYIFLEKVKKYLQGADVICLHSVQSFLSSKLIKKIYKISQTPIVWTIVDMEPLAGGCHFNNGCEGFMRACGNCPQLAFRKEVDISRRIWEQKRRDLQDIPITFVAVNSWCYEHIVRSSLFRQKRVEKIFIGVDHAKLNKIDKRTARKILNLPNECKVIAFGCFNLNDRRKGADYLKRALNILPQKIAQSDKKLRESIVLVTFGKKSGFAFYDMPFMWIHLGELRDDRIVALVYRAADVFASPSIDDFGPMMVNEAFMCGLPVVTFDIGVAPDLIKSKEAGYVAKRYDVDDFSIGILQCLMSKKDEQVTEETRRLREMCSSSFRAQQYRSLFDKLFSEKRGGL